VVAANSYSPFLDNSVAWVVLIFELLFEVCARPKNYFELLKAERAYSPSTVRYINRFHLVFEFIALMFTIPDFIPLFGSVDTVSVSLVNGAINATHGQNVGWFIAGNLFFLVIRLRLFGLGKEMLYICVRMPIYKAYALD